MPNLEILNKVQAALQALYAESLEHHVGNSLVGECISRDHLGNQVDGQLRMIVSSLLRALL